MPTFAALLQALELVDESCSEAGLAALEVLSSLMAYAPSVEALAKETDACRRAFQLLHLLPTGHKPCLTVLHALASTAEAAWEASEYVRRHLRMLALPALPVLCVSRAVFIQLMALSVLWVESGMAVHCTCSPS
eukprot:scaffold434_cov358-Prasinococcus_capsulatus_cf.AAC.5